MKNRDCTLNDFDFLFNLKNQNFKWYVDKIWRWDDFDPKTTKKDLKEYLEHKHIIIYNNMFIGIYALHITENGDCFINEISILKEYQNKGIVSAI